MGPSGCGAWIALVGLVFGSLLWSGIEGRQAERITPPPAPRGSEGYGSLATRASDPPVGRELTARLDRVTKIWDAARHNAFTDLVRWRGKFYCGFREGEGHAGDAGCLRVIASDAGRRWESVAQLSLDGYDLRDAALSVTPDDRLLVLGGAQQMRDGVRVTGTFASSTSDGVSFSDPQVVIEPGRWLWRVTWQGDVAWGVSYGTPEDPGRSELLRTRDGVTYESVVPELIPDGGRPTEARLRFTSDQSAICIHRRDGARNTALLGTAPAPYRDWHWRDLGQYLGGPNFLEIPGGGWIVVGRRLDEGAATVLFQLDVENGSLKPLLTLPSGGDTSYPGMVWYEDQLWISYYSSHEGQTNIYLAVVDFDGNRESDPAILWQGRNGSFNRLPSDHSAASSSP